MAVIAVYVTWQLLRSLARTLLDRWWLDLVTDAPVWSRRTAAQLQVGVAAAIVVAVVLGGSVWLVLRLARVDHGPLHRWWQRYDERVGPAHRWVLIGLTTYLVWHIGRAAGSSWQDWLLLRHGPDLGVEAPEIGGDLGFHLFRLPLLTTASSFVRQLLLVTIGVALFGHAASGALRSPRGERRSSPAAVIHLSLLATALLAAQAFHEFVIARSATATNRIGAFDGPGFTEVDVTRPALLIAALSCLALGFVVVTASRTRRWRPVVVVGTAVAIAHGVGLYAAPAMAERLLVAPAEAERQLWSIEHNLDATRSAYGLDDVPVDSVPLRDGIDPEAAIDPDGPGSIPLFTTPQLVSALQVLAGTPGTRINDVDLVPGSDADGAPAFLAARTANRNDIPEQGWVQRHLVYTHGDGVVTVAADEIDADGRPVVVDDELGVAHAPLYFGEGTEGWYVVVDTRREEFDGLRFDGEGVPVSSTFRRLTLALATGEAQPLLTNEFGPDAQLLYRRGLDERIRSIAPFLTLDSDPYPVLDEGRVTWVVDAYTTAATYPYAQFVPQGQPSGTPLSRSEQNFIRASVKATVDAQDGTVHLYRTDDGDDPIVAAWADIFPGLFEPMSTFPDELAAQLRFPVDLFSVQTAMLGRYHVDDVEQLFNGADRWAVSAAAATTVGGESSGPAPAVDVFGPDGFSTVRTYGPGAADKPTSSRDELAGLAIGVHGPTPALDVVVPAGEALLGPQVAQSAIDADPQLAQAITLLNANGSIVEFGPMTPLVVDDGVAWARPITVRGTSAAAVPRLYGIAVVSDGLVGLGPTVADAIAAIGQSSTE